MGRTLLKRYKATLKALSGECPVLKRIIVRGADKDFFKCLSEIAHNVLKGNIKLSPNQFHRLKRHRHSLRQLAQKGTSQGTKKRIIQKGGFLSVLLPALAAGLFLGKGLLG